MAGLDVVSGLEPKRGAAGLDVSSGLEPKREVVGLDVVSGLEPKIEVAGSEAPSSLEPKRPVDLEASDWEPNNGLLGPGASGLEPNKLGFESLAEAPPKIELVGLGASVLAPKRVPVELPKDKPAAGVVADEEEPNSEVSFFLSAGAEKENAGLVASVEAEVAGVEFKVNPAFWPNAEEPDDAAEVLKESEPEGAVVLDICPNVVFDVAVLSEGANENDGVATSFFLQS